MENIKPRMENEVDIISDNLSYRDQRALIFNVLYVMDAFDYDTSLESVIDNFAKGFGIIIPHESPIFKQIYSIVKTRENLDLSYQPLLDNWRFERLGTATRLIIRIAIWEILNTETDNAVIINEAIELAKCYAEKDAYKFVNGILDEFIKKEKN